MRRDELAFLDVDDAPGAAGFEQQVGLAAQKRGDLQDIDDFGRGAGLRRLVDIGQDRETLALQSARMRSPSSRPGPRYPDRLLRLALSKEALKMKGPAMRAMASAMKWTCSSLSMTQGPAMSARRPVAECPRDLPIRRQAEVCHTSCRRLFGGFFGGFQAPLAMRVRRADEALNSGCGSMRLGLELGMELAAEEPGMVAISQISTYVRSGVSPVMRRPAAFKRLFIFAVEFEAVAMALADLARAIGLAREAAFGQDAGPRAQAHGAAEFVDAFQFPQFEDHAVRRGRIEFGGIGVVPGRRRCAQTRSPWSACRGRCRNRGPCCSRA